MGGGEGDNLVLLTYREHLIAHKLLHEIYPEDAGMALALTRMMQLRIDENGKKVYRSITNTREAEILRKLYSIASSGENNPRYGVKMSDETKDKTRQKALLHNKGEMNPRYGAKLSDETKEKIRQKALGRKVSEEAKKKISESMKGKNNPQYGISKKVLN